MDKSDPADVSYHCVMLHIYMHFYVFIYELISLFFIEILENAPYACMHEYLCS